MSQADHALTISLTSITISGPDAVAFTQAQLTVDVEAIDDSQLHPAAWCNPDGRVAAVLLVARQQQRVTLVVPETLAEAALKRARMYSIGRKVDISTGTGICGGWQTPDAGDRALALSCDARRVLFLADPEQSATPETAAWPLPIDWLRSDIDCGLPWILPETADQFLPQMLGLEALGGLSYRKGCFPGQEVIARVHYRGRLTRRIAIFRLHSERPPAPGTEFRVADKPACVLYAVASAHPGAHPGANPGRESDGLAVVAADAEDGTELCIAGVSGTLVSR